MKKNVVVVVLAVVAALVLCLVGCGESKATEEEKPYISHDEFYIKYNGKTITYDQVDKYSFDFYLNRSMDKNNEKKNDVIGREVEIFSEVYWSDYKPNATKVGSCPQCGYIKLMGDIYVPVVDSDDMNKFQNHDYVVVKARIGDIKVQRVDLKPLEDGTLPIEKK